MEAAFDGGEIHSSKATYFISFQQNQAMFRMMNMAGRHFENRANPL